MLWTGVAVLMAGLALSACEDSFWRGTGGYGYGGTTDVSYPSFRWHDDRKHRRHHDDHRKHHHHKPEHKHHHKSDGGKKEHKHKKK